jgi:hypothetical protein
MTVLLAVVAQPQSERTTLARTVVLVVLATM